jgi:transcriptional regulator with XRE-family HTH domain
MFGHEIRRRREEQKSTQRELATEVGISSQSLSRIELGEEEVTPVEAVRFATALHSPPLINAPSLLQAYCAECPVNHELLPARYPTLDNVPTHPVAILWKIREEAGELHRAAESAGTMLDYLDWQNRPEAVEAITATLDEIRDLEVGIQLLYDVLFLRGALPAEVLAEVADRQRRKCEAKGYCKPREAGEEAA